MLKIDKMRAPFREGFKYRVYRTCRMSRRDTRPIKVTEVPASVLAAYAVRNDVTEIPKELKEFIDKTIKIKTSGFRDFSSLRMTPPKSDSDGFQEVGRRWGKTTRPTPSFPRDTHIEPPRAPVFVAATPILSIQSADPPTSS